MEETLHLALIRLTHSGRTNSNFVPVLVIALFGESVDVGEGGQVVQVDAEAGEGVGVDGTAGVVGEALVKGAVVVPVGAHGEGGGGAEGAGARGGGGAAEASGCAAGESGKGVAGDGHALGGKY